MKSLTPLLNHLQKVGKTQHGLKVQIGDPTLRLRQIGPKPGIVFECVGVPGVIDQIMHGSMRDTRQS